jgi:hypothetical protein
MTSSSFFLLLLLGATNAFFETVMPHRGGKIAVKMTATPSTPPETEAKTAKVSDAKGKVVPSASAKVLDVDAVETPRAATTAPTPADVKDRETLTKKASRADSETLRGELNIEASLDWVGNIETAGAITNPDAESNWNEWFEKERSGVNMRIKAASKKASELEIKSKQFNEELETTQATWKDKIEKLETLLSSTAKTTEASSELSEALSKLHTDTTLQGQRIVAKYRNQRSVAERQQLELTAAKERLAQFQEQQQKCEVALATLVRSQVAPHQEARSCLSEANGKQRAASIQLEVVAAQKAELEGTLDGLHKELSSATQMRDSKVALVNAMEQQVQNDLDAVAVEKALVFERQTALRQLQMQDTSIRDVQESAAKAMDLASGATSQLVNLLKQQQSEMKMLSSGTEHVTEQGEIHRSYELMELIDDQVGSTHSTAETLSMGFAKMRENVDNGDASQTEAREAQLKELEVYTKAAARSLAVKSKHASETKEQLEDLKCSHRKLCREVSELMYVEKQLLDDLALLSDREIDLNESLEGHSMDLQERQSELLLLRTTHEQERQDAQRAFDAEEQAVAAQMEIVLGLEATLRSFSELRRAVPQLAAAEQGRTLVQETSTIARDSNTQLAIEKKEIEQSLAEARRNERLAIQKVQLKIQECTEAAQDVQLNLKNLNEYRLSLGDQRESVVSQLPK